MPLRRGRRWAWPRDGLRAPRESRRKRARSTARRGAGPGAQTASRRWARPRTGSHAQQESRTRARPDFRRKPPRRARPTARRRARPKARSRARPKCWRAARGQARPKVRRQYRPTAPSRGGRQDQRGPRLRGQPESRRRAQPKAQRGARCGFPWGALRKAPSESQWWALLGGSSRVRVGCCWAEGGVGARPGLCCPAAAARSRRFPPRCPLGPSVSAPAGRKGL